MSRELTANGYQPHRKEYRLAIQRPVTDTPTHWEIGPELRARQQIELCDAVVTMEIFQWQF
jgi:hypothetical protein